MSLASWFRSFDSSSSQQRVLRRHRRAMRRRRMLQAGMEPLESRLCLSGFFDVEPNETILTALPLTGGQAAGFVGNNIHQPGLEAQDADVYSVNLAQGDLISFNGANASGASNVRLRLFNSAGTDITSSVSYWNTFYAAQAGTYYVGLSGSGNSSYDPVAGGVGQGGTWTGDYNLTYSIVNLVLDETEPNDNIATANSVGVTVGSSQTARGFLGNGSSSVDKDYYSLFMPASTVLTVTPGQHPQGTVFTNQASLRLLDGSGAVLAQDQYSLNYTSFVGRQVYVEYSSQGNRADLMYAHQLAFALTDLPADPNAPTLTVIGDETINENTSTGMLSFSIGDAQTTATNLVLSGSSSDPSVVPNANIVFGGSGAARTIMVTPAPNQSGTVKILVTVTDEAGQQTSDLFVLMVDPANDAPTGLTLTASSVNENAPNGVFVGAAVGSDPDVGETLTYSLLDDAGGRFVIISGTGMIVVANSSLLDFETATSHNVTVRVTDSGGLTYDEVFIITLNDVNEAPSTAVPVGVTTGEDAPVEIGGIAITDPDAGTGQIQVTLQVSDGTLSVRTDVTGGLTPSNISGNGSDTAVLTGSPSQINMTLAASNGLLYQGMQNFWGNDSLVITTDDLGSGFGPGTALTVTAVVPITVLSVQQQTQQIAQAVQDLVTAGVLNQGQGNSLINKFNNLNPANGPNKVNAFINEVQASLSAGTLTQAEADVLLDLAYILLLSMSP